MNKVVISLPLCQGGRAHCSGGVTLARQWLTPSQDDISPLGQNGLLYRSMTSGPSAAQARVEATHALEISIAAITSPRHLRPPADATGKPRTLLATSEIDIMNARDQKGSSLTVRGVPLYRPFTRTPLWQLPLPTRRRPGRQLEEGAARSLHAWRTHVTSRGAARMGPRTSTGGGASRGGTTQSWTSWGKGGAII
jgi:hypothetical protein